MDSIHVGQYFKKFIIKKFNNSFHGFNFAHPYKSEKFYPLKVVITCINYSLFKLWFKYSVNLCSCRLDKVLNSSLILVDHERSFVHFLIYNNTWPVTFANLKDFLICVLVGVFILTVVGGDVNKLSSETTIILFCAFPNISIRAFGGMSTC